MEVLEVQVEVVAQEVLAAEVQLTAREGAQVVAEDSRYSLEEHMVDIHGCYPECWNKELQAGE